MTPVRKKIDLNQLSGASDLDEIREGIADQFSDRGLNLNGGLNIKEIRVIGRSAITNKSARMKMRITHQKTQALC